MPAGARFGGQGMSTRVSTAALEIWYELNTAFSLCRMLTLGAVEALRYHASEKLQQPCLPAIVEERQTGTMNITEPQAGSDLAAMGPSAVRENNHYRVSGTKNFIICG